MIYSENINKICALCRNAEKLSDNKDEVFCTLKKRNIGISTPSCSKFDYDIFKKNVRRKKRLKTNFSAEDFSLD